MGRISEVIGSDTMPKLRKTEKDIRNAATFAAITRGTREIGLEFDRDIAQFLGMSPQNYSYHKRRMFEAINLDGFSAMARKLELTDIELCAIVGIPYRGYRQ